ncbi:MAG: CDC27 family protein [Candidatus Gastranaerophilales bacterium]|nr:CDC27 family protein [Candidatus Gastranaerophilales bacterium]
MKKIRKLFEGGDFAAASNALDIFLKENPNDTEALLLKGKTLCKLKKYEDALIFLLNAFEKQKTPETEGELGACYYYLKKYNDAQIHLIS